MKFHEGTSCIYWIIWHKLIGVQWFMNLERCFKLFNALCTFTVRMLHFYAT
jgi:hypothetical protein